MFLSSEMLVIIESRSCLEGIKGKWNCFVGVTNTFTSA